jgi:probable rRNA maturation factor
MPPTLLDFQITVAAWRHLPRLRARLQKAAQATVDFLPQSSRFPITATVLLTGNAKIRQLNRDFRGLDKPTNGLSFPQFSPAELSRMKSLSFIKNRPNSPPLAEGVRGRVEVCYRKTKLRVRSIPTSHPVERRGKEAIHLGDIALAYQYIAAEAKKENKPLLDHATHLVIHGFLHLFGYDHAQPRDAKRMEKAETEIMKSLGLPNPYAPPP